MLRKVNVLVTGLPGCGKSTLITKIINRLRPHGFKVGGISTPDFRSPSGKRIEFLIRDITTGDEQVMVSIDFQSKVRVGRYGVDVDAVGTLGVSAINRAIVVADIVVIDEIGKMELTVPEFQQCVVDALDSAKPILGTIGLRLTSVFITDVKQRSDVVMITFTRDQQEIVSQRLGEVLGLSNL